RIIGRAFLRLAGIPFTVQGLDRLPKTPCVVVANHASYIDGIAIAAALPPDFAFVIKKETLRAPLAGLLLRRLGSQFVERFDRHKGATDARRVLKMAATGQSLMFFPEGTFDETRQIGKFLGGAFTIAARAQMPVVAVAIHGTRDVMPPGSASLRRRPIRVEVLAILPADEARLKSRELIAAAVGEPLAP
ncbi:MAG TPA: lysophospholipid acyltransferase family protein, partial [Steroidobacteraceae bacterium]